MVRVRESWRWLICTYTHRGKGAVFLWNLSAFLLCSAFVSLALSQGIKSNNVSTCFLIFANLVRVPNHFCFYLLLYFCESHQDHFKAPCFSTFKSLIQLYLSTLGSLVQGQHKSGVKSSSFSEGLCSLLVSPWSQNLPSFIYFSGCPHKSLWSLLLPMHCTWTCLQSSMPPTQLTQYFHWGNTSIISCYGTTQFTQHAKRDLLVNIPQ